ncbi:hypothetical protein HII36_04410 [Nonomuraea sp. NN258]|uniref:hypothetical protein n=1 Tax=Nonomuraea antri TaxID=2730852 RepID=UPI001568ED56|nr:hypothetical protein [Nonomuraea antri]NRQ31078.1 hypothetical protein [Nonomuraea antri]
MTQVLLAPVVPGAARGRAAPHRLRTIARVLLAAMIMVTTGCQGSDVQASYRPAFLPVKLEWGPAGWKVTGESTLVTPLGVFSIGAHYTLTEPGDDVLHVILRDARRDPGNPNITGYDHIYRVKTGEGRFRAVVNGTAVIEVVDRQILIDVTRGDVQTVEFTGGGQPVAQQRTATFGDKWQEYWDSCFYSPMALSRWAYDDSTMDSWFGLGFVWFLVRLLLAIVLGVVDVALTVGCFLAAVAYTLAGPTARNIMYGLEALIASFVCLVLWAVRP